MCIQNLDILWKATAVFAVRIHQIPVLQELLSSLEMQPEGDKLPWTKRYCSPGLHLLLAPSQRFLMAEPPTVLEEEVVAALVCCHLGAGM